MSLSPLTPLPPSPPAPSPPLRPPSHLRSPSLPTCPHPSQRRHDYRQAPSSHRECKSTAVRDQARAGRRMALMRHSKRKSASAEQDPAPAQACTALTRHNELRIAPAVIEISTLNTEYFKAGCGVFLSKDISRSFKNNIGFYMKYASQAEN